MKKTMNLGKIDYNGTGRKINLVEIEVSLQDGRLSICGDIWDSKHSNILSGGQNIDEIAKFFPNDKRVQSIKKVWERWHLNDVIAGSPNQEDFLKKHPLNAIDWNSSHYDRACEALKAAGLNPDPNYAHNGKPYEYGSAWLKEELPQEVITEVESW